MIKTALEFILNIFRFHKSKIFLTLILTLVFTFLLFPFGDLSDLLSTKIAEKTHNQVFVTFNDMGLTVVPRPGLSLDGVYLETSSFPPMQAEHLVFTPSFGSVKLAARGIYNGNIDVLYDPQTQGTKQTLHVEVDAENLRLDQASKAFKRQLNLDLDMKGNMDLSLVLNMPQENGNGNMTGDVSIDIKKLGVPSLKVPTPAGNIDLPGISLAQLKGRGRLADGRLSIEDLKIGDEKDGLNGRILGSLNVQTGGGQFQVTGYELTLDLTMRQMFLQQPGVDFFTSVIDNYENIGQQFKSSVGGGVRYAFKLSASSMAQPPRVLPPAL